MLSFDGLCSDHREVGILLISQLDQTVQTLHRVWLGVHQFVPYNSNGLHPEVLLAIQFSKCRQHKQTKIKDTTQAIL